MSYNGNDTHVRVDLYRQIVLEYERINAEIAALFAHGGGSDHLTDAERARYRTLSRRRDELQNEMRLLEQQLLDDDSTD